MAKLAGVERGIYENYEKGVSKFPYPYFKVWCVACGTNLNPLRDDDAELWRKSPNQSNKSSKEGSRK